MKHNISYLIEGFQKAIESKDEVEIAKFRQMFQEYESDLAKTIQLYNISAVTEKKLEDELQKAESDKTILQTKLMETKSKLKNMESKVQDIDSLDKLIQQKETERIKLESESSKVMQDIEKRKEELKKTNGRIEENKKELEKQSSELQKARSGANEVAKSKLQLEQEKKALSKEIVNLTKADVSAVIEKLNALNPAKPVADIKDSLFSLSLAVWVLVIFTVISAVYAIIVSTGSL